MRSAGTNEDVTTEDVVVTDGHTHETACLNCLTPLVGDHCHACGQRRHVHRTLASLFHDLAHGVFHFEGKIWRTVPMLAWKPGEVTRRYIDGERAKFVSPLALFLFSVFVLAAVLGSIPSDNSLVRVRDGVKDGWDSVDREKEQAVAKVKQLEAQRAQARAPEARRRIDREIASLRTVRPATTAPEKGGAAGFVAESNPVSKFEWINERWRHAKKNPDLLIYKLKNSAYKFSWVLVPMSVPFMWLLFPFSRRFRMYDHAIFVIYSLASISLLTVVLALVPLIPGVGGMAVAGLLVLPPIHMYRQLRGAYALGRLSALVRTFMLLMIVTFVMAFWISFLILVGAA